MKKLKTFNHIKNTKMKAKELSYKCGLTKESKFEVSKSTYDLAKVTKKEHLPEEKSYLVKKPEQYNIIFKGFAVTFNLDDKELFDSFHVGDEVWIEYKEVWKLTFDYIPPDFHEKHFTGRKFYSNRFISARKKNKYFD